jgi:hypothetical protein
MSQKRAGPCYDEYSQRRREFICRQISLVEIDLLREGERMVDVPRQPAADYCVHVHRSWKPTISNVYHIRLEDRLPSIEIPLRKGEPCVLIQLQSILDQCYSKDGYHDRIDYSREPIPALDPPNWIWVNHLLRLKGYR